MRRISVVQIGLGEIGQGCARLLAQKSWCRIVGGIDISPRFVGRDLSDILKLPMGHPAPVYRSLSALLKAGTTPKIAFLCTGSTIKDILPTLKALVKNRIHVVSSAEDLFFMQGKEPKAFSALNKLAKEHNVSILGTGINPGFVMDLFPVLLTQTIQDIKKVEIHRSVDIAKRRKALQNKLGMGLSSKDFSHAMEQGLLGHKGLENTAAFVAYALGWKPLSYKETLEPKRKNGTGARGMLGGIHHATLKTEGGDIALILDMWAGAKDFDRIRIFGTPPVTVRSSGFRGDEATPACLVNAAPLLLKARRGVLTPLDLFPAHWTA